MTNPKLTTPSGKTRATGLGLKFSGKPGEWNSITDVEGIRVGYVTLKEGSGKLTVGQGPIRTGVTAILPRPINATFDPVFAGIHSLNGNGELTGSHYIEEVGKFGLPITITNTHSCGTTRDATIEWATRAWPEQFNDSFGLPVAAETYDGFLNDINGFHITKEHVFEAIESAITGPIEEGSIGGGTGMKCFGFKAGSGTASRLVEFNGKTYTIGSFVQANFGAREELTILGNNIGAGLIEPQMIQNSTNPELSSIIGIIATDAPLLPHQLKRLARRIGIGMSKTGGIARHGSGDIFLAFSTANHPAAKTDNISVQSLDMIPDEQMDPFFTAVVQATEEAIINSIIANEDTTGRDDNFVPALPHDLIRKHLQQ